MYQFSENIRKAYELLPIPLVFDQLIDGKVVPLLATDGFCRLVNMSRDKVLEWFSESQFERLHPDDVGNVINTSKLFAEHKGEYKVMFRSKHGDGYHYIHAVGEWMTMDDGTELAVIVYTDINESGNTITALAEQYNLFKQDTFFTDPLTNLPNINYLNGFADEKVHSLFVSEKIPVLIYVDVNSMQSYNYQYGVAEGDKLLKLTAKVLTDSFPGALVARSAEDHFIVVTALEEREQLTAAIDRANRRIKKEAFGNTTGFQAGISVYNRDMRTTEAIDHAKHAMKRMGTDLNTVYRFFRPEADELYWKQRYIVENFDTALEKGWFRVYYQKIASVKTGKKTYMEALARWVDPARGIISPGEILPVLKKYHLIHKMDLYIFEQVCREVRIRYETGVKLCPVSVNFSRQDFDHVDVAKELDQIISRYDIAQYGIDKNYFIIEITEQDMAMATDHFYDQLKQIKQSGFRLWLDDFGSGYSSLNVFSKFDVDLIKFDMDLLRNLDEHGGANREIMRAMVEISRKMGISTLAEGMETEEQYEFLEQINCDYLQGFAFHRPEPLDTILYRLHNSV